METPRLPEKRVEAFGRDFSKRYFSGPRFYPRKVPVPRAPRTVRFPAPTPGYFDGAGSPRHVSRAHRDEMSHLEAVRTSLAQQRTPLAGRGGFPRNQRQHRAQHPRPFENVQVPIWFREGRRQAQSLGGKMRGSPKRSQPSVWRNALLSLLLGSTFNISSYRH